MCGWSTEEERVKHDLPKLAEKLPRVKFMDLTIGEPALPPERLTPSDPKFGR